MEIKMLETRMGSPDGVSVFSYSKGKEYELPEGLARVFINEEWAKPVNTPSKTPRRKDKGAAPENKSKTKVKKP
ncbi:MAG: hypothetical protein NPINA01_17940 [Nitrospinaceae bacterium]|nr:MAG: hypothetical protein NPINA01_17940 [Nitrospinaceae bacterium]